MSIVYCTNPAPSIYALPDCSICEEGYATTLAYTCTNCGGDGDEEFAVAVIAFILAAVGLALVVAYLISKTDENKSSGQEGASREGFRRLVKALPLQALKTVVVSWQILTQVKDEEDVGWFAGHDFTL